MGTTSTAHIHLDARLFQCYSNPESRHADVVPAAILADSLPPQASSSCAVCCIKRCISC
jgi:hypothetical protein